MFLKDKLKKDSIKTFNDFVFYTKKYSDDENTKKVGGNLGWIDPNNYPIPEIGVNLQKKKFENMVRIFNYEYSTFFEQNKEVINLFDAINKPKIHKVYSFKAFCNEKTNLCATHDENNFFFFDGYHPSLEGARMINNLIMKKIDLLDNN